MRVSFPDPFNRAHRAGQIFFSTCEKQKRRFAVSGRYLLENTKLAFFVSKQAAHIPRNYKAQQSGLHL
jgi:hypothetical protein